MSITKDQIITVLEDIVSQYGEDHTAQCQYWNDSDKQALCIAGVAFVKLGADEEQMYRVQTSIGPLGETIYEDGVWNKPIGSRGFEWARETLKEVTDLDFDRDAFDVLEAAQRSQDNGQTWGVALEAAKAKA